MLPLLFSLIVAVVKIKLQMSQLNICLNHLSL